MATVQGTEQTTLEAGPAVHLGQSSALRSQLWKEMQEKFLRGEPKVLGVVQILIALINLSLGIIMMSVIVPFYEPHPISFNTAYPVWGSVMFIISGSFSIAAATRTTKGLVQASLGLNIASSVLAASGIMLSISSLSILSFEYHQCIHDMMVEDCSLIMSILTGVDAVMFIFSVLEFCIAVFVAAFGCKVTCCNPGGVVLILPPNPPVTETASGAPF
ncbi:membrane-spanning 4-domains subfamily A member 4A-like [Marmota marmota marmota]|uniref:membrane-spanning 4-domains subfamily A member 4A-like n=1 Tax=Marmota marmota marmota TaxID=9994 RepID=UPI000762372E|nr:membrane-spanning 4-domains subfamily A member 4A-like [Marmota marmota marmota]